MWFYKERGEKPQNNHAILLLLTKKIYQFLIVT